MINKDGCFSILPPSPFFCHAPAKADAGRERSWFDRLSAYYRELGIDAEPPPTRVDLPPFGDDMCKVVEDARPDVVSLLPRLLWHMDEPVADTAFITTYLVSEFARRDVTVILSGVGGDATPSLARAKEFTILGVKITCYSSSLAMISVRPSACWARLVH
jgi:hypothetical protein